MNSNTGIRTREQILLINILWIYDSILLKLSKCSSTSEAAGGCAWGTIGDLGGDGGTDVLGAVAGDVLIVSNGDARGIDDNILAKGGEGGDLLGSINDSVVQLAVADNGDSSAMRRVPNSTRTGAAHHSHIGIGSRC
jgi:hypothetical protein